MAQYGSNNYSIERWSEDYSYFKDAPHSADPLDAIKYVPLGNDPDWYLSFGGQARYRFDYFRYSGFGSGPQDDTGFDLVRLLAPPNPPMETNDSLFLVRAPRSKVEILDAPDRLPQKWRPRTEPKVTKYDQATGKAIVFRDSFAGTWYPFLGYHFREVLYIWQYEWNAAFLQREKPTVVIDEMLERFFYNTDPAKLLQKEALP